MKNRSKVIRSIARRLQVAIICRQVGFALLLVSVWFVHVASGQAKAAVATQEKQPAPKSWIDPKTGHSVIRVSEVPNTQGLPFNHNAFTPDGRDMIYTSPKGIYDLNLSTLQSKLLVSGKIDEVLVGTVSRRIYYRLRDEKTNLDVRSTDIDTSATRLVGQLPILAVLYSINADETLLSGTTVTDLRAPSFMEFEAKEQDKYGASDNEDMVKNVHPGIPYHATPNSVVREQAMKDRYEARIPEEVFTMSIGTGKVVPVVQGTDWLANVQFSPTDPGLLMYAHEGPPALADRIWTVRTDGSHKRLVHFRTDHAEVAMNEFWSHDGKTIWFEAERPARKNPFLVAFDLDSGRETYLHLSREEAALHFSQDSDQNIFSGGGRNNKTEKNAVKPLTTFGEEWIEVLEPKFKGSVLAAQPKDPSSFTTEKLVDMSKNNYVKTDPNTRFSPDGKLVFFTSDMFGPRYLFAVKVK